jgi:hypothetical protein
VLDDVPPFSIAVGSPARVIRRYSFLESRWIPVERFGLEEEAALPSLEAYLDALRQRAPAPALHKLASGYRMGHR